MINIVSFSRIFIFIGMEMFLIGKYNDFCMYILFFNGIFNGIELFSVIERCSKLTECNS